MPLSTLHRTARSLGLLSVGVLSTLGALSLAHIGPASAQSPGVNLAQIVATVGALKTQQVNDEKTIASQGNTIISQGNTIISQGNTIVSQGTTITSLQTLTAPLSLSSDPSGGGTNTLLTISGVNVQIVNGLGGTETANGLGNLIVGYNEKDPRFTQNRTGSHNLVVGTGNNYLSYGGLIAGQNNLISAPYASITGGQLNVANNGHASVTGGAGNVASGGSATISGGQNNKASADFASVSGGYLNTASGSYASVAGGYGNTASGDYASVSGGQGNLASGFYASVSGGQGNTASGFYASVSGGRNRNQGTDYGWTAGSESGIAFDTIGNFRSP
jgi:hypothetical protein